MMQCSAILAALQLCTADPEPPPQAYAANADSTCMTQAEARAVYKTSHLYWHGRKHCWDDRAPAARRVHVARHHVKENPELLADANGNPTSGRTAKPEIFFPPLMQQQADIATDIYAVQRPITEWPLMLDIDITGPDPDKGIDGCCWPSLEELNR